MKFIIIIILLLAFAIVGFLIYDSFKRKKVFYNNIVDLCLHLSHEIRFSKNDIKKIITSSKVKYCNELKEYLQAYLMQQLYSPKLLNENENIEVVEFLESLGKFDVDGELKNINKYKELFKNKFNLATQQEKTKGAALFKIFIILGLLVAIILL